MGGPALPDLQHAAHFGAPAQLPIAAQSNNSWASDFQSLHISGPSPAQLQGPLNAPVQGGWQNEFFNQRTQQQTSAQYAQHLQSHPAANRGYQPAFAPGYPMYNASMNTHQTPQEVRQEHLVPSEQFDESAFEAAFEQARTDMELQGAEATLDVEQRVNETDLIEPAVATHEEIRIGSDTIPQTDQQDPQTKAREADALAQTAGQLLDSVRHEQNEKFQQSNFLALMRRIRDREVEVKGDEFREVSSNP